MKWVILCLSVLLIAGCAVKNEGHNAEMEKNTTLPPVQINGNINYSIKG